LSNKCKLKEIIIDINSDDKVLIDEFLKGNQKSFNLIVLKYQKRVYWVVRRMTFDHDISDDITQEVFIKLYFSLKDFRRESNLFTYIYRIAVNLSLNEINKNRKLLEKKVSFDDYTFKTISGNSDPMTEFYNKQQAHILEEAVSALPSKQRAVFVLKYYDNLTFKEIGSILKRSTGGSKANFSQAIKKIQNYLKEYKFL
jgi:RNA polymerase sigma factor (sigma-70 family)